MAKWPRVQFVFYCKTCDEKITFSIHFGENEIWNHKDARKLAAWQEHQGHETELKYEFFPEDDKYNRLRTY
jgi:hypothetical protein